MTFPSDLHELVDKLGIATRKLSHIEEEVARLPAAQEEVARLRTKLIASLNKLGFSEEAVDLLLAAR